MASFVDEENDEVFISGLPLDVTEEAIAEYFGQIGIIKQVRAESCRCLWQRRPAIIRCVGSQLARSLFPSLRTGQEAPRLPQDLAVQGQGDGGV